MRVIQKGMVPIYIKDALLHRLIQFYHAHADCATEEQSKDVDDLIDQYVDMVAYVAKLANEYNEKKEAR